MQIQERMVGLLLFALVIGVGCARELEVPRPNLRQQHKRAVEAPTAQAHPGFCCGSVPLDLNECVWGCDGSACACLASLFCRWWTDQKGVPLSARAVERLVCVLGHKPWLAAVQLTAVQDPPRHSRRPSRL